MYSGWSKRSYSREKKSWLAHLSAKMFSLYITLLQFCFLKEDYSVYLYRRGNRLDKEWYWNKAIRDVKY